MSGGTEPAERFPGSAAGWPASPDDQSSEPPAVDLLRRFRAASTDQQRQQYLSALLLSINCISSGFGATG